MIGRGKEIGEVNRLYSSDKAEQAAILPFSDAKAGNQQHIHGTGWPIASAAA